MAIIKKYFPPLYGDVIVDIPAPLFYDGFA
jgi:hypothetical protein